MHIQTIADLNDLQRDMDETQSWINAARSLTSDIDFQIQLDLVQIRVDENRVIIAALMLAIPASN